MYEAFFKLKKRPFAAMPDVDAYFAAKPIEAARVALGRVIERAAGPALLLGPAGTGKSLLLAKLAHEFAKKFDAVHLTGGRLRSVRTLLQNILFELKLPFRDMSEGELRLTLLDRLEPGKGAAGGLLLLVDEAHVLSPKLLDELRMITNLMRGGQPRVRLVLAGGVRLEERFANPRLASFQQRLAARCYLSALSKDETLEYVRQQLKQSGAKGEVFDEAALSMLHKLTSGVPRVINQLADHALQMAADSSERRITFQRVEAAWADLQQLPTPQPPRPRDEHASSIVEFGALEDDTVQSAQTHGAFARLDDLEEKIARLADEDFVSLSVGDDRDAVVVEPSPFGEEFEEEEVLIDRYASLEARVLHNRPRVSSSEGRAIAALMGTAAAPRRALGIVSDEQSPEAPPTHMHGEAFDDPFDPASDPVMPEFEPTTNVATPTPELVVIDNSGESHTATSQPQGRVKRQEYRQLFARLRRGG